ncbi:VOC family protein [Variovorax sp. DT-64]|uniref:VOC family protein n=1 Tax=Variovorax sp. DT-64 TaxID=3396160 RepID=UPI003F1CE927
MTSKNTVCLWYDGTALEAANFYAETFPDSAVGAVMHAPGNYPDGKQGDVLVVEFTVAGIPCIGLNGGPQFKHSEAFSFQIATDDQAEPSLLVFNALVRLCIGEAHHVFQIEERADMRAGIGQGCGRAGDACRALLGRMLEHSLQNDAVVQRDCNCFDLNITAISRERGDGVLDRK